MWFLSSLVWNDCRVWPCLVYLSEVRGCCKLFRARLLTIRPDHSRHAIYLPYDSRPPPNAAKELYLIPLRPGDPSPDFTELIDNYALPKERSESIFLGVFITSKDSNPLTVAGGSPSTPVHTNTTNASDVRPSAIPASNAIPPNSNPPRSPGPVSILPSTDQLQALLASVGPLPLLSQLSHTSAATSIPTAMTGQGQMPPPPPGLIYPPPPNRSPYPPPHSSSGGYTPIPPPPPFGHTYSGPPPPPQLQLQPQARPGYGGSPHRPHDGGGRPGGTLPTMRHNSWGESYGNGNESRRERSRSPDGYRRERVGDDRGGRGGRGRYDSNSRERGNGWARGRGRSERY